jgi:hypothetical protein
MRRLFVSLAVCSLVACQKQEPAHPVAAKHAVPVAQTTEAKPTLTFAAGSALVANRKAVFVPMKLGPTQGLAVPSPPDSIAVYHLENNSYLYDGSLGNATDRTTGQRIHHVAPDGQLRVTDDLLEACELAILRRTLSAGYAKAYVDHESAIYVTTTDGNPTGGLVYESPEGYTNLYRYSPTYGYVFVDEVRHIRVAGKAHMGPEHLKELQARLAQP